MRSPLARVQRAVQVVGREVELFDVRQSRVMGVARSLLALAQVSILLLTPTSYLFVPVAGGDSGPNCDRSNGWTAFCLQEGANRSVVALLLCACLALVISGFLPRYTGLLHVWVTYSISTGLKLPDGGEGAAQVFTLFLALILLSDDRLNHWQTGSARTGPSRVAGLAWAGWWGLRLQVFWIYVTASVAKFSVEEWADGSALYYVTRQVFFGVDGPLEPVVLALTSHPFSELLLTWGSLALELTVAVLILFPYRYRRYAVVLSMSFHVGIIVVIGLWSFGMVMIAGVCAAGLLGRPPRGSTPEIVSSDQDGAVESAHKRQLSVT